VGYLFARWLEWTGLWGGAKGFLGLSKIRLCEFALLAGSAMTLSRGPWIGGAIAALGMWVFRSRNVRTLMLKAILIVLLIGPLWWGFSSYVAVSRSEAASATQETAAYRHELIEKYVDIVKLRPLLGWGFSDKPGGQAFPIIDGMASIDNYYLLLALQFGEIAFGLMVFILLWTPLRLIVFGLRRGFGNATGLLAVTLAGVYIAFAVSIGTAWLGGQDLPIFFLIAGWSEGILLGRPAAAAAVERTTRPARSVNRVPRFERVMV